jgi:ubiquinone/menaquinone biosynthesis C-methylase UbiE
MFKHSADIYDAIYQFKDYARECETLMKLIAQYHAGSAKSLLDVACGTGKHIDFMKHKFKTVDGLDLEEELIAVARKRNPSLNFHVGDMTDFRLHKTFDVVTCLFSAIGYTKTTANLQRAVKCMSDHLNQGGVLIVEPWFTPDQYIPGTLHSVFVDKPELRIARMNISQVKDGLSILDMHYLVGTTDGIENFSEHHELAMFTEAENMAAFESAGLTVSYDPQGLMDRGLYIGVKR